MSVAPSPREQSRLLGHADAEAGLLEAARSGRLHHAWLINGSRGIGKATLAFRFARWLLAGQPAGNLFLPPEHPVFRRVAAGTHADLLSIGRAWDEKKQRHRGEIVAEEARPIAEFLRRTAAEGGWRVVVLDEADTLNRHAANAVLKILEEPPPRAVLLLATSVPGRLLPTIRSRCRALRLEPLDDANMDDALSMLLPDATDTERTRLARLSRGSPGQALLLAGEGGLEMDRLAQEALDGFPNGADALAERVLRRDNGFSTFLSLLASAISVRVRDAARGRAPPLPDGIDWPSAWQQIRQAHHDTERFNLDKRQALLSSLNLLSER